MVWNALIPVAGSLLGGLFGSNAQSNAARQQSDATQYAADQQRQTAQEQLAFTREMMDRQFLENRLARERQSADLYPRQRASNSALQKLTDLYGLGDIYAAPEVGSLGGQGAFYSDNPFDVQQQRALASLSPGEVEAYRRAALGQYADMPGMTYFDRVNDRRQMMAQENQQMGGQSGMTQPAGGTQLAGSPQYSLRDIRNNLARGLA